MPGELYAFLECFILSSLLKSILWPYPQAQLSPPDLVLSESGPGSPSPVSGPFCLTFHLPPKLGKIEGWRRRGLGNRGWDGWRASPTRWTWVWASSRNWWTGKPCVLNSMGSQRCSHNWVTELYWDGLSLCCNTWSLIWEDSKPSTDYTTWVPSQEVSSLSSDESRLIRMISNFKDSV